MFCCVLLAIYQMSTRHMHRNHANGHNYGVRHILIESPDKLLSVIEAYSQGSEHAMQLIQLGAVYLNHKRVPGVSSDLQLQVSDYLRIHTEPRRYSSQLLEQTRLVFENEHFIVVNKPSGVPVHATVDNRMENCLVHMQNKLNCDLHITHRLDVPTQGLLLIAKTAEYLSRFNQLLSQGQTKKHYRAVVHGHYSGPNLLTHYMEPSPKAPKKISAVAEAGWAECRLEIVTQQRHANDSSLLEILLHTGRTHQIRSQLSFMNHPIVGDTLYGSSNKLTQYESILLQAYKLSFTDPITQEHREFQLDLPQW